MRSEIRRIRAVYKAGAHGDPNKIGSYIYGSRPDGKTVPCRHEVRADGVHVVSSTWRAPDCKEGEVRDCLTELSAAEWQEIMSGPPGHEAHRCELVLNRRK